MPMPSDKTQHKLDRIRPPRVQITYDVQIGNAIEKKEIPLVIGVLADLVGKSDPQRKDPQRPKVKQRKFVNIDRDNFNDVMASIAPKLIINGVELKFNSMDDFTPPNLVAQVPALQKLLDARNKLSDLLAKLDGNDDLDSALQRIVKDSDTLNKIKSEGAPANA
jgi:type VI secretion system protein ImpB